MMKIKSLSPKTKMILILAVIASLVAVGVVAAVSYVLTTSDPVTVHVDDTVVSIKPALISSQSTITIGASITLTVDCTVNWASKTVRFFENGSPIGSVTTNAAGVAQLVYTPTTLGDHLFTAGP